MDGLFILGILQDTLKVFSIQVSPVEIQNVLLANPKRLIDATVAGVGCTERYWEECGMEAVKRELKIWDQENLRKYKWLMGGMKQVRFFFFFLGGRLMRMV
jgi:hypothetical protein